MLQRVKQLKRKKEALYKWGANHINGIVGRKLNSQFQLKINEVNNYN